MTVTAYIALGSNLGDRVAFLRGAARMLDDAGGNNVTACSPAYETEALVMDGEPQPPYLNAVVQLATLLSPISLLVLCHEVELWAGRVRDGRQWKPRTLDLDILLYGDQSINTTVLRIPHPRLAQRKFVLQPLADLAPNLIIPPPVGLTAAQALAACNDTLRISPFDDIFASNHKHEALDGLERASSGWSNV